MFDMFASVSGCTSFTVPRNLETGLPIVNNETILNYLTLCVLPTLAQITNTPANNYSAEFQNINNNIHGTEQSLASAITAGVNQVQGSVGFQTQILEGIIRTQHDSTRSQLNGITSNIGNALSTQTNYLNNRLASTEQQIRTQVVTSQNIMTGTINASANLVQGNVLGAITNLAGIIPDIFSSELDEAQQQIFDALSNVLEPLYQWLMSIKDKVDLLLNFITHLKNEVREEFQSYFEYLEMILNKIKNDEYSNYDEFEHDLDIRGVDMGLMKAVLAVLQFLPLIYTISKLTVEPFTAHLYQLVQTESLATLLDPSTAIRAHYMGFFPIDQLREELSKQGINQYRQDRMINSALQILSVDVLRNAYLRGIISEDELNRDLEKQGYQGYTTEIVKSLFSILPPVNDLVRMAVREVFSPQIAQQFGLFEDYPQDFDRYAQQQGLSSEWARNYWAAHWELPSLTMGYEMFHRRIITREQLDILLRAQDVMPFWRDKLTEMSYNPLTRVDVRRMHDMGLLDDNQVYNSYLDIGYSPENANHMLAFTKAYNDNNNGTSTDELKQLTRSTIERAYKRGIILRDEAINRLVDLGYTNSDANLLLNISEVSNELDSLPDISESLLKRSISIALKEFIGSSLSRDDTMEVLTSAGYSEIEATSTLDLAELEHDLELRIEIVDQLKKMFVDNIIDETTLRTMLLEFDFTTNEIDKLVGDYTILSGLRTKKLTKSEYLSAFFGGIIDQNTLTLKLQGLGYFDDDIQILLQLKGVIEDGE